MLEANSHWRGRRVLVTGCTGFLGGNVVEELLANGAEVIGLVRDRTSAAAFSRHQLAGRIHIVYGRVEDLFRIHSALAVYEAHAVFHLANCEPIAFDRGVTTVFEAVRRYDPRIPVVMARPAATAPITVSPVPLGVARFGELFGQGDRKKNRFVPSMAVAMLNGERLAYSERGSRDFVPVRDAARGCLMLAEAVAGRPTPHVHEANFRTGWTLTDREMSDAIREVCSDRTPRALFADPPSNPFGWSPSLNFSDAIADTVEWCREVARLQVFPGRTAEPKQRAAA